MRVKSLRILFITAIATLGIGHLHADESLETGSLSIRGKLLLDYYYHELGENWQATKAGYRGTNFNYTHNASSPTSPSGEGVFGETLYLDIGFKPFSNLSGDLGFEFIRDYADRYWLPVNLEHRMSAEDKFFNWNSADITYSPFNWGSLRYFRNIAHQNWFHEGDLFNLYPAQNEPGRYLRISGRSVPEGWQAKLRGSAGKLELIYGSEVIWDHRDGVYANYSFYLGPQNLHLIYRDHIIPYGDPDERMRAAEVSTAFDFSGNNLQVGAMYQPFRLNRDYTYVEDAAPGTGLLGSSYNRKTGTTSVPDAVGVSARLALKPLSIFSQMIFGYTYQGLVAGNKQEGNAQFIQKLSRSLVGSIDVTYRKPLLGPVPLIYEGSSGATGPALFEPRGPESPFWVNWDNREASIISAVLTFDPTPDTWFYRFQPNLAEEWNLNPEENSFLSFAAKYTLSRYYTTTDRLLYWDENGHLLWEPALVTGAWATDGYIGALSFLGKMNIPRWQFLFDFGFGESLALNSFAYTTSTAKEKPITSYFISGVTAKTGPYTGRLRYEKDYWGPEEWHRQFGQTFDELYRAHLSRTFGEYFTAGLEYTRAREYDFQYVAPELGYYDEFRAFVTISFGPFIPYFGKTKPRTEPQVGEAPELDFTPPQVELKTSASSITPDGDGADDTLVMEPWASDYSGVAKWRIDISNSSDTVVKTFSGEGDPPATVIWDGTDDLYGKTVPEGTYTLCLSASDEADNAASTDPVNVGVKVPLKVIIKEVPKEIKITETERGLMVSLTSRVLFDFGKSSLKASAFKTLDEVVKILNAYPENDISVEGHTDSIGSDQYNQTLSEKRARSVADHLVKKGIDSGRIKITGFGEQKPAATNSTAQGREANRRVEVIILK